MDMWLKIFKVFVVIQNVQSQLRLVVNTTCLELAKPSNQQFRLTCSQYDYHCLLDETFTKEFEVCREWKWIPGGNCAYFNTYGSGNVDERQCESGINLNCSERKHQFESNKNTQFTACYAKKEITSSLPTAISPIQVTSNRTSDGDIATSHSTSKVWIIFCIAVLLLSSSVIFFILWRGYKRLCKKVSDEECDDDKSEFYELALLSPNDPDNTKTTKSDDKGSIGEEKSADKMSSSGFDPVIKNNEEEPIDVCGDTVGSLQRIAPPTDETISVSDLSVSDEECDDDKSEFYELAPLSPQVSDNTKTTKSGNNKSADDDDKTQSLKGGGPTIDDKGLIEEEKSADKMSSSGFDPVIKNNEEEPIDVFSDTVGSLQRIAPPTEEQNRELCEELFKLLDVEGRRLSQEVMVAIITKMTGKSVKELIADEEVRKKWKEIMHIEVHHLLNSSEYEKSINVAYGLLRIALDKEHYPKSGWTSPVKGESVDIGEYIETLYKIHLIVSELPNHLTKSVESYISLLDTMVNALTRLDPEAEFKEEFKAFAKKMEAIKYPSLIQTTLKTIKDFFYFGKK